MPATESLCIVEVCKSTERHRTPDQILGPYFPAEHRLLAQDDLTSIKESEGRALGEIIEVRGRVLDVRGRPVRGVRLTIGRPIHSAVMTIPTTPVQYRQIRTSSGP